MSEFSFDTSAYIPNLISRKNFKKIISFYHRFNKSERFSSQYYQGGHILFACQAAFPMAASPDMLYRIYNYFNNYEDDNSSFNHQPEIVSDLILSPLMREVGFELFEMEEDVQNYLRFIVESHPRLGLPRVNKLIHFINKYTKDHLLNSDFKSLAYSNLWTFKAYMDPVKTYKELSTQTQKEKKISSDHTNLVLRQLTSRVNNKLNKHLSHLRILDDIIYEDKDLQEEPTEFIKYGATSQAYDIDGTDSELHKRIQVCQQTSSKSLDLSGLGLVDIPKELMQLDHLEILVLDSNKITEISGLENLNRLVTLKIANNSITKIKGLETLSKLQHLNLDSNKISKIQGLDNLSNLKFLKITNNKIRKIEGLTNLTKLKILNLAGNEISKLEGLKNLSSLNILDLGSNSILSIGGIENIVHLTSLNLSNNQIKEIQGLESSFELISLSLRSNNIIQIDGLDRLNKLNVLDLGANQISKIEGIHALKNLEILVLDSNKIFEIANLDNLIRLNSVSLSNNHISEITPLIRLFEMDNRKIVRIDLRKNLITGSASIFDLANLGVSLTIKDDNEFEGINLFGNPIQTPPPEIIQHGKDAIKKYFRELRSTNEDYLFEARVFLLGEGGVGKTSLSLRLKDRFSLLPEPNDRTRGLNISRVSFPFKGNRPFTMHIWDFGGKEIYHGIHRLFFTKRSLYVLLTETRRQDDNFDYWIPIIRLIGQDCPILVVKNLFQGHNRKMSIGRFRQMGFNIPEDIIEVDLRNNEGLDHLEQILQYRVSTLPHIGDPIPKSWLNVRYQIENQAKDKQYISFDLFIKICEEQKISGHNSCIALANYLHDLGIILWFEDVPELEGVVILNPEWVIDAVYRIVDDKIIHERLGVFYFKDIIRLLDENKYYLMHQVILRIMLAQKFCFKKKNIDEYLIPTLLSPDPPEDLIKWNKADNLKLQFVYSLIPKGIVNQFSTQMSQYIKSNSAIWSRGVWLEYKGTEAIIEENWIESKVEIKARGLAITGLLSIIINEFENLHSTYPGIEVKRLASCICTSCSKSATPEFYDIDLFLERFINGRTEYYCNASDERNSIEEFIFSFRYSYTRSRNPKENPNPFIENRKSEYQRNELDVKEIQKLMSEGSIGDALNALRRNSGKFQNEILLLTARYNSLESKRRKAIISEEQVMLERNKITSALIEISLLIARD